MLRAKNGNLIVELKSPEEKATGTGIVFNESVDEVYCYGTVVSSDSPDFKVGDKILYSRYVPYDFQHDGKYYAALEAKRVIAVEV